MTIYGWDASHYDAPQVASAVADGIVFITHKAGGDRLDDELDEWWANARGLDPSRVLLGAYWVLYPNNPVARADAFLARLDAVCVGWRNRPAFILQVDCEKWGGDPSTVPPLADIRAFCDRLTERMGGKLRPIVYAPKWVYGDTLKGLPYPLWASSYVSGTGHYKTLYPGDSSTRWGAYSGQTPAILQYTSSATIGTQTTCDANAFRGTLAQLQALVAPGWEDDMTPDELLNTTVTNQATGKPVSIRALLEYRDTVEITTRNEIKASVAALGKSLTAAITALAAKDTVDEQALAAALAPGVAAAVVAQMPQGGDAVTQDEVNAAVLAAFRQAFTTQTAPQ